MNILNFKFNVYKFFYYFKKLNKIIFDCFFIENLKSLKGGPKFVGDSYFCCFLNIERFDIDNDIIIVKDFDCSNNKNLKSLKNGPKKVGRDYCCRNCGLDEIDLDKDITIGKNLICLEGNNVTKKQVEEYIKKNNINLKGGII